MFSHIFKMIWNRKKSNALIIAEIAIAFMVVFALSVLTIRSYHLYHIPLGFNYENMWRIDVSNGASWKPERDQEFIKQLLSSLQQESKIESVHLMSSPAFKDWVWSTSYTVDDKEIYYMSNRINDGAAEGIGLKLLHGRWFNQEDDGQIYNAVIVNQRFVDEFFPNQNIVGFNIAEDKKKNNTKVVGVFEDFRQLGELSSLSPYVFHRLNLNEESSSPISGIEIKLKAGTRMNYEQALTQLLKNIAPQWDYTIRPWRLQRETQLREDLLPLIIFGIVGSFLIIMVALGLFGVLWQNVTSRTRELGLRRALGATSHQIHRQIISELLIVNVLGIAIALTILIQLPILGVFKELDWSLFFISFIVSAIFMITLAVLCAFYPGKVATNFAPAQALHYE